MDHLIAKTKGKKGDFFKVLSNKTIFTLPTDLNNKKVYDPNYKLEDDEWFVVEKFSEKDYCIDFIKNKFESVAYSQIDINEYPNIEFLCSVHGLKYFFQKRFSGKILQKKYFAVGKSPKLVIDKPIIVIDDYVDAIYDKGTDTLYFKNLNSIKGIFKGIDILYREATNEETEEFLKNEFIKLDKDFNAESVKTANRKRIAIVMDTLKKFSPEQKKDIFSYIHEYIENVKYENDKFEINSEEDLKHILYGIEERYYTTRFGAEKRLANSVTPLK